MSVSLDKLKEKVEKIISASDSAEALLSGLSQEIRELKDDPVQLEALADRIDAEAEELSAAVLANTPAVEG